MSLTTAVHLNFRGTARHALEHYRDAFDGALTVVTYADAGSAERPEEAEQVMWGQVVSPAGFHVMAYDVPASRPHEPGVDPVFVSVRATDGDELRAPFDALADGGTVRVPLAPAAWAPLYGMVTDRFGVTWVLDVEVAWAG